MRLVIENVLLFLLPAALYGVWRYVRAEPRERSLAGLLNGAPLVGLFIAGALLVATTRIYYATVSPGGPPSLTYTPPRMGKDGSVEPGQLK